MARRKSVFGKKKQEEKKVEETITESTNEELDKEQVEQEETITESANEELDKKQVEQDETTSEEQIEVDNTPESDETVNEEKVVKEETSKEKGIIGEQEPLSDQFVKKVLSGAIDIKKEVNASRYLVSMAFYKVNGKVTKLDLMTALQYKEKGSEVTYESGFIDLLPGTIIPGK